MLLTIRQFQFNLIFIQRIYIKKQVLELFSFFDLKDYYSFCILAYYNKFKNLTLSKKTSSFFDQSINVVFKYDFFKIRIS